TTPDVVIRPILVPVYQRLRSGPAVISSVTVPPAGPKKIEGMGTSVTCPAGVIRPIKLETLGPKPDERTCVNQRLPSGPAAIWTGAPLPLGNGNSVTPPPPDNRQRSSRPSNDGRTRKFPLTRVRLRLRVFQCKLLDIITSRRVAARWRRLPRC